MKTQKLLILRKDWLSHLYFLRTHTSHLQWWIKSKQASTYTHNILLLTEVNCMKHFFVPLFTKHIKAQYTLCVLRIILDYKMRFVSMLHFFPTYERVAYFSISDKLLWNNDEYENDVFNFINHIGKSLIRINWYNIALLICDIDLKLNI